MPTLPADLEPKTTRHELLPFVVVGVLAVAVDFAAFNLFLWWDWPVWLANAAALLISMTVAFAGNYRWTFAHREIKSLWHAYTTFAVINVAAVVFIELVVVLVEVAAAPDTVMLNVAKAAATVVATVGRFVAYRRWVFF